MNSDVDFVLGVDEVVRGFSALGRSPAFYYQFSYDGGLGLLKRLAQITRPGKHALYDFMSPYWTIIYNIETQKSLEYWIM